VQSEDVDYLSDIYNEYKEELHFDQGMDTRGLGIGDWGLGPIPNPQSPIPNPHPQSPLALSKIKLNYFLCSNFNNTLLG
jgi:hypothetical protein